MSSFRGRRGRTHMDSRLGVCLPSVSARCTGLLWGALLVSPLLLRGHTAALPPLHRYTLGARVTGSCRGRIQPGEPLQDTVFRMGFPIIFLNSHTCFVCFLPGKLHCSGKGGRGGKCEFIS